MKQLLASMERTWSDAAQFKDSADHLRAEGEFDGDADTGFAMSSSSAHATAALRRPSASLLEVVVVGDSTWANLMDQQDLMVDHVLRSGVHNLDS